VQPTFRSKEWAWLRRLGCVAAFAWAAAAPQNCRADVADQLGVAAWTFRDVTFLEAIEKAEGLGVSRIEAFESQKLAPDDPAKVGGELSADQLARIKAALEKHGLTLTSIYVGTIPGEEAAARTIFERVKRLGARMIVSEPKASDLDVIEPLCGEYGIDLALHNHPDEASEYRDPKHLAGVLASRGPRIGACCDTGHWQRRGLDTVAGLKLLEGRVFGVHMKDLDAARPDGHDMPWGTGVGRIADVLAELTRQQASPRIIAVEYEYNVGTSLPEIARCVAFFREQAAAANPPAVIPVDGFLAGWATGDLTPDRPVLLEGQLYRRISKGVRDPITCTALAIESRRDGSSVDHAVLVSCDFCTPSPALLDELARHHDAIRQAAAGLDPAKIVLNATHTHTGPVLEEGWFEIPDGIMPPTEYREFAAERIANAAVAAWNARRPAATSWAISHATVAHNRRVVAFDPETGLPFPGSTTMYGDAATPAFDSIEGGADTAVSLVFLWSPAGDLTGLIVNLPCPSQETEHEHQLSADFWHETRLELAKLLGAGVFVLPQGAAGGDCTSHVMFRKAAEEEMLRRRGLSGRQEIARRIVNAVSDAMPIARGGVSSAPIVGHAIRTIDLPMQLVSPADRDRCAAEAERSAAQPDGFTRAAWHRDVVRRYDEQQATMAAGGRPAVPVSVHAIRLGDVAFITNTFEMFGDYGVRLQARSPATLTCVVQLAGRGTPGTYLPTARAVTGGGYSAVIESNWVGPAGGRLLVDENVRMLQELWAPQTKDTSPAKDQPSTKDK
jgi:sugar phosphate isomerase/epimerase